MLCFPSLLYIVLIRIYFALGESITDGIAGVLDAADMHYQICTHLNATDTEPTLNCPTLRNAASLTQTQLIDRLTSPCRYDRLERPCLLSENNCLTALPLDIYVRIFVSAIQIMDADDLKFKIFGLLQLRYSDARLAFENCVARPRPIFGDSQLRARIWVPHIFFANEQNSAILGINERDIFTMIMPDGMISVSARIQTTLSCWTNLTIFPFDEQHCSAMLESWMYNSSEVVLHWEDAAPVAIDSKISLTEYILQDVWRNETIIQTQKGDLRYSLLGGNYSSIGFTMHLTRVSVFYMMEYFLPSIMIVAISWVSFWLQADQTPARTTLGTSTMLSFITLASSQGKNFSKASYIKMSEVWFFGCTLFIFGSLIEFAFVNTIWRRNRNLELKEVNSKYILKSTLTPKTVNSKAIYDCETDRYSRCSKAKVAISSTEKISMNVSECDAKINHDNQMEVKDEVTWSTMTPHEVSLWIDRKARFVFPLLFLIFNAVFWTFIFCL